MRDPLKEPRIGDIIRSSYPTIGERHVVGVGPTDVTYIAVVAGWRNRQRNCLHRVWREWCRSNRATIVQLGS